MCMIFDMHKNLTHAYRPVKTNGDDDMIKPHIKINIDEHLGVEQEIHAEIPGIFERHHVDLNLPRKSKRKDLDSFDSFFHWI